MRVWDHLKDNFKEWSHVFCSRAKLVSKDIMGMVDFQKSEDGSKNRHLEMNSIFFLSKFVGHCESQLVKQRFCDKIGEYFRIFHWWLLFTIWR